LWTGRTLFGMFSWKALLGRPRGWRVIYRRQNASNEPGWMFGAVRVAVKRICIYIMIINLSGDDDDVVWVCGVCGDGVQCVCVCSLHYCRHDGVIHIYMSMVCVSLKRRIWRRAGGGGWEANTTEMWGERVGEEKVCCSGAAKGYDETLLRAQLDVWLSNFRGQSFATRESLQMTDLPLARASTEDAAVHHPLGVRGVYYIIAYCCSHIGVRCYKSPRSRGGDLSCRTLWVLCVEVGNLRLVSTAWWYNVKARGWVCIYMLPCMRLKTPVKSPPSGRF